MALVRWLHKWFGLVLGLQFLLWAASGAVMATLDPAAVSGRAMLLPAAQLPAPADAVPLAAVQAAAGTPPTRLEIRPLYDRWVYVATTGQGVRLVDAHSGQRVTVDAAKARELAVAAYAGSAPVAAVERLTEPSPETRGVDLPVWRAGFADDQHTALLVSDTGEVEAARTDAWRLWDIAWMLHIMDYGDRAHFNHPLVVTVATGCAWLALSGLILLFRSFRRSEFSWIVDRFPRKGRT